MGARLDLAAVLVGLLGLLATLASAGQSKDAFLKIQEDMLRHKGAVVRLLRLKNFKDSGDVWVAHRQGRPTAPITDEEWETRLFGKTGVLTDVQLIERPGKTHVAWLITVDGSSEQISLTEGYGRAAILQTKLDSANEKYVGRRLWAKGHQRAVEKRAASAPPQLEEPREFVLRNLEPITVTSIELGGRSASSPLYPCFKTAAKTGCVTNLDILGLEQKLVRGELVRGESELYARFYTSDPKAAHPKWLPHIWKAIESEQIAIGMTLEMARLVCAEGLIEKTKVLSLTSAEDSGIVYTCYGDRGGPCGYFLVQGDKIVKCVKW